TETELAVASVFADVLGVEVVGLDDNFFALGGNSLVATRVVARLRQVSDISVPLQWLFQEATVEDLAARMVQGEATGAAGVFDPVVALREDGAGTPMICVHPIVGLSWCYT